MKRSRMFVSLRDKHPGYWSHLGYSRNATYFSCQSIFFGALEEIAAKHVLISDLSSISAGLLSPVSYRRLVS